MLSEDEVEALHRELLALLDRYRCNETGHMLVFFDGEQMQLVTNLTASGQRDAVALLCEAPDSSRDIHYPVQH